MSVARPLARLLPRASRLLPRASRPNAASFSSTPLRPFPRQRPSAVITTAARLERARPYTAEEVRELSEHYTPPQLSALLVGEEAIAPEDIARASQRRNDAMALPYIDDLSSISPVLDHVPGPLLGKAKVDKEGYPIPRQPLPKIEDPAITWPDADVEGEQLRTLAAHTGFSVDQLRNMRSKTMVVHSVVNQTRMGKIRKIYVLSIAGNGNGLLGIGEGKATETEDAIRRAGYMALRNMEPIHRYEGRTIFGNVEVKVGAVEMKLFTRPPGFGVRCSQYIFEMCRAAGIHDLSARVTRSRNPMNVIKTFMHALRQQKLPETIARGRGKKFVDVRKVYYGANL